MHIVALALVAGLISAPSPRFTRTFDAAVRPVTITTDTTTLRTLTSSADLALTAGDRRDARRRYEAARWYADSSGDYAGRALWALANLHFADGRELRAAAILDELADQAARHGRVPEQARALLESGVIYLRHGRLTEAADRRARLLPLIESPALSAADRTELRTRVSP